MSHYKVVGKNWVHEKGRPGGAPPPRGQGRTEFMRTGVPEVIVLEARAAFGTLRASERKRENILLSIHRKTLGILL